MIKKQRCFNCGKDLGEYEHYHGDIETCGAAECEREARNADREEQEAAQEAAQRDNFERYRW